MNPLLLSLLFACGSPSSSASTPGTPAREAPAHPAPPAAPDAAPVRNVDVGGLKAAIDRGGVPLLLDVRTPEEFVQGHVPGAVNIPVDQVEGRTDEIITHRDGDVYLICRSGGRSLAASKMLAKAGFHPVNVEGGTLAWQAAGYPVE